MEPDIVRIASVFGIIAVFGTFLTIVGVTASRFIARTPKAGADSSGPPVVSEARFARLEQAIDVIAVEVERIAEAQRFSAQLMSEKALERQKLPAAAEKHDEGRLKSGTPTPT